MLIRDEGHRNPMNIDQLTARMAGWLAGEYRAVLFEDGDAAIGYALYRREPQFVYLRQMYIVPQRRRQGVGRAALRWLWRNAWSDAPRLRIDVLVNNESGCAFWRSVGFEDYCITMEAEPPPEV
jgi:GNAT superfamily N-acetyltransferase